LNILALSVALRHWAQRQEENWQRESEALLDEAFLQSDCEM